MKKRNYKKIIAFMLVFSINFIFVQISKAGEVANESDTMTSLTAAAESNHAISFVLANAIADDGSTITITFPAGFLLTDPIIEDDVDISGSTTGEMTTAADCTGAEEVGVGISGQIITFTICTGDNGDLAGSETVTIEIGTNATASGTGANQITNPSAGNDYQISIGGTMSDSGSLAVSIITSDSVTVSATVDSTFTFTISSATCALGTLSTASVSSCTYTITTTTNAEDGYTTTIIEDGNLRDGTPDIDDVSDGTVTAGSEEYGASSNDADSLDIITTSGDAASPITGTAQSVATQASGPVSADAVIVTHHASIASTTIAGSYSHIVTLVSTGTF